ncbi:MAG: acetyl-CoA hydrolase/transferase C-terminal domain-containing protein [Pseudomonadota bacterium]
MTRPDLPDALARFRGSLPDDARVYVGGCSGEPLSAAEAMANDPSLAKGVTFSGIWIPGVNRTDWSALSETSTVESIFISADLRAGFEAGRVRFLPLPYTQAWPWLETAAIDGAIVVTSPPDGQGRVSFGVSPDFAGAVIARPDVVKLAIINPSMPAPPNAPTYPLDIFDLATEQDTPLPEMAPVELPPAFAAIAGNIASLIEDGDTLQFGLGNVQQATLGALTGHRGLSVHSGMISNPLMPLLKSGAVETVTAGVAIGTRELYDYCADDPRLSFNPVSHTHALATLAAIPNFKAINSIIEVDLFGQANAEFINGKQVSGTGGLVDFLRGAGLSKGGRAITALASTARGGTISRIVPRLAPNATSITRADIGTVVTEHGAADLRGLAIDARAGALIEIADPAFRDRLANDWDAIRSAM